MTKTKNKKATHSKRLLQIVFEATLGRYLKLNLRVCWNSFAPDSFDNTVVNVPEHY